MPIKWYGSGDKTDPTYKHFSRVVNLVLHAMLFAAVSSTLWFVQQIRHPWSHLNWFSEIWIAGLLLHLIFVVMQRPKMQKASSSGEE